MSFLLRSSRRAVVEVPRTLPTQASFFSRSSVASLKESDRDTPDQAERIEKHKQDLLNKHKTGKGHWKPELASASEEAVKGDREAHDSSEEGMKKLQEQTKHHAQESSK